MNLSQLATKYNTNEKCIERLEQVRWGDTPICPHCESDRIAKRKDSIKWHCNNCNKDSTVLYGTIFENSKMPLNKWFQLIFLMINAKMGISSKNLSRDIGVTYKTAWYSAMRVRCAMLDWGDQLEGIVEMDETYVGGKPRKRAKKKPDVPNTANLSSVYKLQDEAVKRGRGTKKVPVAGIVERKGHIVTKVMSNLSSKELLKMLQRAVNTKSTTLMTDDFKSYKVMDDIIERFVVNHSEKEYSRGAIHTNTIEGFWSIVKGGLKGQYRVLSKKYLPFYLAEYCYRYNRRQLSVGENFNEILEDATDNENKFDHYKPVGNIRRIVYPPVRKGDTTTDVIEEDEDEEKDSIDKLLATLQKKQKAEERKKKASSIKRKKRAAEKKKLAKAQSKDKPTEIKATKTKAKPKTVKAKTTTTKPKTKTNAKK